MSEVAVAFYVTVSAAAAGMFGLGTGLLSGRLVSLAERASAIARERVDLAFTTGERFGEDWRDRHRLTELAAIHRLSEVSRRLITLSLAFTGGVVLVTLLVVAGILGDTLFLRWILIVAICAAGAVWITALRALAERVSRFTARFAHERQRRRSSQGSGIFAPQFDSEDVDAAMEQLLAPLAATSRLRRLRSRFARWRRRRKSSIDAP